MRSNIEQHNRRFPQFVKQEGIRTIPLVVYSEYTEIPANLSEKIMSEAEWKLHFKPISTDPTSREILKGELLAILPTSTQSDVVKQIVESLNDNSAIAIHPPFLIGTEEYFAILERQSPVIGSGQHYPTYIIHLATTR